MSVVKGDKLTPGLWVPVDKETFKPLYDDYVRILVIDDLEKIYINKEYQTMFLGVSGWNNLFFKKTNEEISDVIKIT